MANNEMNELNLNQGVVIDSQCIAQIDNRFFLIIELDIGNIEQVLVIAISRTQALRLAARGVGNCDIVDTIPTGSNVEIRCTFTVGTQAYTVFEVGEGTLVLVRTPLCTIL